MGQRPPDGARSALDITVVVPAHGGLRRLTRLLSALDELKDQRLVRFVLPSHGRSVVRYRQVLEETLGIDARQCAILAILLLRGPQTVGELRIRTERMAQFDGLDKGIFPATPDFRKSLDVSVAGGVLVGLRTRHCSMAVLRRILSGHIRLRSDILE